MAITPAKRACSACGTLLADDSAYCPVCALRGAVETQSDSGTHISSELCFEHYQVLKNENGTPMELGHGGMGVTYKAIDTHLGCPVALKIISTQLLGNESARSRFLREARAAASVHHANVATVFHLGESAGNYFYAMEFVDGETLETLIRRRGRLEIDLALDIVTQVASGLTAIHKQHLVHRDIKPSNIMLSWEEGRLENVKIIDLGLAKGVAEDTLSIAGSFIGTPAYASLEQFSGLGTDIRSDLYSLGVTLWEMLSGKPPFHGSAAELMDQHQHAEPPTEKLKGVPTPAITLLQVLLAKDPNQRFQTPAQLQKALTKVREAVSSGSKLTADELKLAGDQVPIKSSRARPGKQAIRWLLGAGLCFAVILIAGLFYSGPLGLFNQRAAQAWPTEKSIAVLPFENISPNKDDAYFADGVQDEILNNLAKIAQLKVICRTSVMQYRADTKRDLRQIAIALGVANVLEGTVRRDGNHVRVSTELVDAHDGNTIWADSYDRDLTDIFAIQSDIAQTVASRLSAQLSPEERKHVEERPTNNLDAYDLYLQAKQLLGPKSVATLWGSEKEAYSRAVNLLREAIRKDQKFALAYCWIARAHDYLYVDGVDHTPERRALADEAVNEALRLQPELAMAHLALALHLCACYRDFERARVQIAMAAQTMPNDSDLLNLTAQIDQIQGRWEQATAGLEKASRLDPRNPELLDSLSNNYQLRRLYRDNERILERLIELEPHRPLFPFYKANSAFYEKADLKRVRAAFEALPSSIKDDASLTQYRIYYAVCARDFEAAEEIVSKTQNDEIFFVGALVPPRIVTLWLELVRGNPPTMEKFGALREQLHQKAEADQTNPFLILSLAFADVSLGRKEEAVQEGERAMRVRPVSEDAIDGAIIAVDVAVVYTWANQLDSAFQQLSVLIKIPSIINYGDLKTDPIWDPLRKDPRFEKLLAELAPRD